MGGGFWTLNGNNLYTNDINYNVGIGTQTPQFRLSLANDGGIIARGTHTEGATLGNIGSGDWFIWYPRKAAFRAGYVPGTQWDDANIGFYSVALGRETIASDTDTFAVGAGSTAQASNTIAMGYLATAGTPAHLGSYSVAIGTRTSASANFAMVLGNGVNDTNRLINSTENSLMVGFNSTAPTVFVGPSAGAGTTGRVGIGTASPQSALHVATNYIQFPTVAAAPAGGECGAATLGRVVVNTAGANPAFYVCRTAGSWAPVNTP